MLRSRVIANRLSSCHPFMNEPMNEGFSRFTLFVFCTLFLFEPLFLELTKILAVEAPVPSGQGN